MGDARRRIADAEQLGCGERDALLEWCERLAPQVAAMNTWARDGLVHGDADVGNLLRESCGRVVLCDFDPTCVGPWQLDLAAVSVGETRFDRPGAHASLVSGYGYDVTTEPGWPLLRHARELKMVVAAVPLLGSTPGIAEEFQRRLGSLLDGDTTAQWTPFAKLRREGHASES